MTDFRERGWCFYRRPMWFCAWDYGIGAISVGYQPETRRHGIFIGVGRRENPPEGEVRFRWCRRWHIPEIRILWRNFHWQDADGEWHPQLLPFQHDASVWTGRCREVIGFEAFGWRWWWT